MTSKWQTLQYRQGHCSATSEPLLERFGCILRQLYHDSMTLISPFISGEYFYVCDITVWMKSEQL